MPKTTSRGTAKKSPVPSTLKKSPEKAQRTFSKFPMPPQSNTARASGRIASLTAR